MKKISDMKIFVLAALILLTTVIGRSNDSVQVEANSNSLQPPAVEVQILTG